MLANNASVTKSPKLAAIGVATLSGLIPHFLDPTITPIIIPPRTALANEAVTKLLAANSQA